MKKLWLKFRIWIDGVLGVSNKYVQNACKIGIKAVDALKYITNSEQLRSGISLIVSLTKTKVDDTVYVTVFAWLEKNLDKIAMSLNITASIAGIENTEERLIAIIKTIRDLGINERTTAYTTLAALVAESVSDGIITANEIHEIVKVTYDNREALGF